MRTLLQLTDWHHVEVLELARQGIVRAEVTTFSLDDATAAYDALRSGSLHGRAVVVP